MDKPRPKDLGIIHPKSGVLLETPELCRRLRAILTEQKDRAEDEPPRMLAEEGLTEYAE